MCGIAGVFLPRGATTVEADMDAMLGVLRHRGPDGGGRFVSEDKRYQAGFTRLAIIDLATGDQPILDGKTSRVLTGNGEIYNYKELRAEDGVRNYAFKTAGDMEVVLPLADRLGDGFVYLLNGMFALALYGGAEHRLLLVRDRLGIKPLYWAKLASGGLVYASEIKALFASGLIIPAVDEQQVSAYLAHGYVPGPATLYRGVRKLPPGHLLKATSDGTIRIETYWRAGPAAERVGSADEAQERLLALMRDSVRLQLRSDVPVGALLSGGLDSGLMVALAAEQTSKPLNTFTVRFAGAAVDESPLAAAVAERYGTNHQCLDLAAGSIGEHLLQLIWHCEEPVNDAALLPNFLIERLLSDHVTVALNGTGGDELFAGYRRYFQLPVERFYTTLPAWARRGIVEPLMDRISPMTGWQLRRAGKFVTDRGGYLHDHSGQFPPPVLDLIGNRLDPGEPAQGIAFAAFDGPADTGQLVADLMTYLPEDLLLLLDRTSMAVSVEGRVPFLDHRLVEAALAVAPAVRAPNGAQKGLERRIAAKFLPEAVLKAPKQGFASPVPAWLSAGLAPVARRILCHPRALERGWWTARGIDQLLADPARHGFRIYSLLVLELSIRVHVEDPRLSAPPGDDLEALADAA